MRISLRSAVLGLSVALLVIGPGHALAQAAPRAEGPPADSYRRAAAVVRDAIEVHGGLAAVRGLRSIEYVWDGEGLERYGGRNPALAFDSAPPTHPIRTHTVVDLARGRWMAEVDITSPGGFRSVGRSVLSGRELLFYDAFGSAGGTTFSRDSLPPGAPAPHPFTVNLMPPLLLRQALTREATLRHLGMVTEGGRPEHLVTFSHPDGSLATLRFDAESRRLVGVASLGSHPLLGDLVPAWRFGDFRTVDGLLVPYAFEHATNGVLQLRSRLARVAVNGVVADSLFVPPRGYTARPSSPRGPTLVDAGGGVYFVEGLADARAMFVDTEEGIVAVEAPGSPALVERALELVERALPGRPLRYVVLTHHHSENLGGLPAYVARGVTLLVPPGTEAFLRTLLAASRTFGAWTRGDTARREPRFETVQGRRRIGGVRGVELVSIGQTSHATGMLVALVPAKRLLFQTDLLRVNDPGGPVAGTRAAADLLAAIGRLRLPVDSIASARGRTATMSELRQAASPR